MRQFRALVGNYSLVAFMTCSVAMVTGCGNSTPAKTSTSTTTTPTTATYVYAIDAASSDIYAFAANSNGTASPAATLTPPTGFTCLAVATDSSGKIYVAGTDTNSNATVLVYAKGASGVATPATTLLGGTNFVYPASIVVDGAGNIYVLDTGIGDLSYGVSVSVYAAGASGSATPTRTITDDTDDTLLGLDLAVDSSGNVYVSTDDANEDSGVMVEYASTANGDVTPTRTITTTGFFYGIAVDGSGNIYVAQDVASNGLGGAIVKYGSTASGAATPTTTITGSSTEINTGGGLRLDSAGNIFMINETPTSSTTFTVNLLAFSSNATGNAAPMTSFSSSVLTDPQASIALF